MDRIKAVVFDIGNVLMRFSWWPYINGLFDAQCARAVSDAIWNTGWWNELDRGVLSPEQIIAGAQSAAPSRAAQVRTAFERAGEACFRLDYAIPWIESVKARGCRALYLSNYSDFILSRSRHALDFLPHLEGGVFSCRVGLVKPEPAIYTRFCELFGLRAGECLFIDDRAVNVALAHRCGMKALVFEGFGRTAPKVAAFLGR